MRIASAHLGETGVYQALCLSAQMRIASLSCQPDSAEERTLPQRTNADCIFIMSTGFCGRADFASAHKCGLHHGDFTGLPSDPILCLSAQMRIASFPIWNTVAVMSLCLSAQMRIASIADYMGLPTGVLCLSAQMRIASQPSAALRQFCRPLPQRTNADCINRSPVS